jgi:AraC-like DNA-binding protein
LINLYDKIINNPGYYRQLCCGDKLITLFNCPQESKYAGIWSHRNYIMYVIKGRKIWHSAHGLYDLSEGSCVFVRKGSSVVEQLFDDTFCLIVFFVPDEFICDVLKSKTFPIGRTRASEKYEPIIGIDSNITVETFFQSMIPHFEGPRPDPSLLELKFRELILTLAGNSRNNTLLSYFCSLLLEPRAVSLQNVMEDNYCSNLNLEQFARLSNRSLSAFKRDFQRQFNTTPGKWLMEKRLHHAMYLLTNSDKPVSDVAYESGFENPSHFSRSFRQLFGVAPASVRQMVAS